MKIRNILATFVKSNTNQVVNEEKEPKNMASFKSILSDIGSTLKKFFTKEAPTVIADLDKAALVAQPFVDAAFPGMASLYNITVAAVGRTETDSIAAGAQNGTGAQKLALVVSTIESDFNTYWTQTGHSGTATQADIETYVNGVVATLNAVPKA